MNSDSVVIVPVYNEAKVIYEVIEKLATKFKNIICVDDGSTDLSALILKDLPVTIVSHRRNKGQGAALQTGINYGLEHTDAKYFVTFDGDGQHRAEDAAKMVRFIKLKQLDVVLGSRFLGQVIDMSKGRFILIKLAIIFTHLTTGLNLTDTHNGLRVFSRQTASNLKLKCSGMAYASEIMYRIADNNLKFDEYPVVIRYTDYSKQKGQAWTNMFNILFELTKQRVKAKWTE